MRDFLGVSGAIVRYTSPEEHDRQMAIVQALTHALNIVGAATIAKLNVDTEGTLKFTSPIYKMIWATMGRIISRDPELYGQIQISNSGNVLPVLDQLVDTLTEFRDKVRNNDLEFFTAIFKESVDHFGSENLDAAQELASHLVRLLADLSEENAFLFQAQEDRPGILQEIAQILGKHDINLTSFHSFPSENNYKFLLGLSKKRVSRQAQAALAEIRQQCPVEALPWIAL